MYRVEVQQRRLSHVKTLISLLWLRVDEAVISNSNLLPITQDDNEVAHVGLQPELNL